MKKLFSTLTFLLLFSLGVRNVFADTSTEPNAYISSYYDNWEALELVHSDYQTELSDLISYYNSNYSSNFSHYAIVASSGIYTSEGDIEHNYLILKLLPFTSNYIKALNIGNSPRLSISTSSNVSSPYAEYYINLDSNTSTFSSGSSNSGQGLENLVYSFDTDFYFTNTGYNPGNYSFYNSVSFPSYSNITYDVSIPPIDLEVGDKFYSFIDLKDDLPSASFTEVDLSDYDYIILSLKNYNVQPFSTTIFTTGSLCFTPVYNYGMKPKSDYFTGYQTQGCTDVYSTETPVNIYIIQSDITYHSVYYIKQESNVPTILNIPTTIFDITYITSQNASDPQVIVGGRSYPVIPFDDLSDTANISTQTGYISGQTCVLGDVNCIANVSGVDIDNLFSNPLSLLQSIWTSITGVFVVIGSFISILPPTLQAFLYTSFILGLIIGIIKIIL